MKLLWYLSSHPYTYICIHVYIYIYVYTYVYIYIYVCVNPCIYVHSTLLCYFSSHPQPTSLTYTYTFASVLSPSLNVHLRCWHKEAKWMFHVAHEWVMSHMNKSCPMCASDMDIQRPKSGKTRPTAFFACWNYWCPVWITHVNEFFPTCTLNVDIQRPNLAKRAVLFLISDKIQG